MDDTARRIASQLGELSRYLSVLSSVDHQAPLAVRRVDHHPADVAAVSALGDIVASGWHRYSPFISSFGSTPNASASLRTVRGCASLFPDSSLLIVSKAIPVISPNSRRDSARSCRSCLNRVPSTAVNLLLTPTFYLQ